MHLKDEPACRVCFEPCDEQVSCRCKGSMQLEHQVCTEKSLQQQDGDTHQCTICKGLLVFKLRHRINFLLVYEFGIDSIKAVKELCTILKKLEHNICFTIKNQYVTTCTKRNVYLWKMRFGPKLGTCGLFKSLFDNTFTIGYEGLFARVSLDVHVH